MRRIKEYLMTDCISFTVLMLVMSVLDINGIEIGLSGSAILEFFLVTTVIEMIMWGTDRLVNSMLIKIMVDMINVIGVVFLLGGGVFGWFPMEPGVMLLSLGICAVVYGITYVVFLFVMLDMANKINKKLEDRKHGANH